MNQSRIVLGVSGGIAAYKAPQLVRDLKERGADVRVVLTESAQHFVTPLALQTVSEFPVATELLDAKQESTMGHIDLARWADQVLIAPATANTIAQLAHGHANDLLSTLCLATRAPITIAPAMNSDMWQHPLTQKNIASLKSLGITVLDPDHGMLACGETGPGRMMDTDHIANLLLSDHSNKKILAGRNILITAGPTHEAIDPVRYIANRSSGKMGYALAEASHQLGANVTLISGPTSLNPPQGVTTVHIESADQMHKAVTQYLRNCDIFIGTAAVCDYRVETIATQKIKKNSCEHLLKLMPTIDIISQVAQSNPKPLVIGFAAETENVLQYANEKLHNKQLDMIIANDVSKGNVFGSASNSVTICTPNHEPVILCRQPKVQLAKKILQCVNELYLSQKIPINQYSEC